MSLQDYVLGADNLEMKRLLSQANVFDRHSKPFITQAIRPGDNVLEIGCGNGGASQIIMRQLDHRGHLTAIELQENYIQFTTNRLSSSGYSNFTLLKQDISTLNGSSKFDVIYGRTILHHLSDAKKVIADLLKLLNPGDRIAFEEPIVNELHFISASSAYVNMMEWYNLLGEKNGTNFIIGKHLPQYFNELSIETLELQYVQPALLNKSERSIMFNNSEIFKPIFIKENIVDELTFNQAQQEIKTLIESNSTLFYLKICQILGRK